MGVARAPRHAPAHPGPHPHRPHPRQRRHRDRHLLRQPHRLLHARRDVSAPPFHPGYVVAGTVEATGAAVTTFKPGDRIVGGMLRQDLVIVDTARGDLDFIPDGVSFAPP